MRCRDDVLLGDSFGRRRVCLWADRVWTGPNERTHYELNALTQCTHMSHIHMHRRTYIIQTYVRMHACICLHTAFESTYIYDNTKNVHQERSHQKTPPPTHTHTLIHTQYTCIHSANLPRTPLASASISRHAHSWWPTEIPESAAES